MRWGEGANKFVGKVVWGDGQTETQSRKEYLKLEYFAVEKIVTEYDLKILGKNRTENLKTLL